MYANYLEENVEIVNDMEEKVIVKRIQTIDDIWLISEIIAFTETGNFDRILGHCGAIGLIHVLEKNYIYPKTTYKRNEEEQVEKKQRSISHYSNNRNRGFYSNNRR
jgi:hypothetical protein